MGAVYQFRKRKKAVELFTLKEGDYIDEKASEIFKKYSEYFGGEEVEDYFISNCIAIFYNFLYKEQQWNPQKNEPTQAYFSRLADLLEIHYITEDEKGNLKQEGLMISRGDYRIFCAIVSEISLVLYLNFPDDFFPILFREQFDVFMKILDILGTPMPNLPAKSDKKGRLLLYMKI